MQRRPNYIVDFVMSKMYYLLTDTIVACGVGAVLPQNTDGRKMPIAYVSRKLLDRKVNYAIIVRASYTSLNA